MKIKFCGVKNRKTLDFIKENAVDFVGLNFVPTSKRKISLEFLEEVVVGVPFVRTHDEQEYGQAQGLPLQTEFVAVFQNGSIQEITETIEKFPIFKILQLHGSESREFIQEIRKKFPELKIWKAFSSKLEKQSGVFLSDYFDVIDLVLLDGSNPGSGQEISDTDWLELQLQVLRKSDVKYGIAGGINKNNILDFRKKFSDAYLLDTASGIEKNGEFSEEVTRELLENFQL